MFIFKQGSKFLCWNSFKAIWYWGPLRLSEKFQYIPSFHKNGSFEKAREMFPNASVVYIEE